VRAPTGPAGPALPLPAASSAAPPVASSPTPEAAAAPAQAPPPPPAAPPPQGDAPRRDPEDFQDALKDIEASPDRALDALRRCLMDDPAHPPSHALRLYALHRLGRVRDFRDALEEAKAAGATPARMDNVPHFRRLVEEERRAPKLPRELGAALQEGLARPAGPPRPSY
jgi:hypothetical protein